ncbi:cysteine desulfurase family protein [Methylophaga sp.]|uniref:cysteine desulfurase family protein n=1 Tax=Methylophaga sp. TaxID=2024840 RepID=UPI003A91D36D
MLIGNSIYLDYQATTPLEPEVREAMAIYSEDLFANPHSAHFLGRQSAKAAEMARTKVESAIGASTEEVIFTSGATEANNQAIATVLFANTTQRKTILISAIEHKCIKNAAYFFAHKLGYQVSEIPVDSTGLVDIDAYQSMLNKQVLFVSIMAVNNEIGVVQPVLKLAELAHEVGAIFHCDAAQAPEAIDIDVKQWNVDMLSLSAHKVYGPKGIGALYIKNSLQASLPPFIHGGGQQFGLRSGTLPTGLSVGFAKAMELCREGAVHNRTWLAAMKQRFLKGLKQKNIDFNINGTADNSHPGCLNIRFANVNATNLLAAMQPEICASTGSACNSEYPQASHVLSAIGLTEVEAMSSLRFSFGRYTDAAQIDRAVEIIYQQLVKV